MSRRSFFEGRGLPLSLALGALALGLASRRRGQGSALKRARPLSPYLDRRLVVLGAERSLAAAARAMEANDIGAVLVERGGRIVGVVTDRDLALRGLGHDDPPPSLGELLGERPLAAVTDSASLEEVIDCMKRHAARRIPILDLRGRARGIVSLDDLLIDGHIAPAEVSAILRRQLGQPAPFKRAGDIGPSRPARERLRPHGDRGAAHAENTLAPALDAVAARCGLQTRVAAEEAFLAVMGALAQRITYGQAFDLLAQLPSRLRQPLSELPPGPDKSIDAEVICRRVMERLAVSEERAAEIARGVFRALSDLVSAGVILHLLNQLPSELREFLTRAPVPPPLLDRVVPR